MARETGNRFLTRLRAGGCQTGFWLSSACATVTEVAGGAGFDFAVIDAEHSPNTIVTILDQMRALEAVSVDPVVRPASNDTIEIRRCLDIGARTILVPLVNTAEEARAAVAATRYPPAGIRGVSMGHRAFGYGRRADYFAVADREICVVPQIETLEAVANLEAIAAVDGIAAVFVGPADLTADMGLIGQTDHEDYRSLLADIAGRCAALGIRFGTLVANADQARARRAAGAGFVAVGTDIGVLRQATDALVAGLGTHGKEL